MSEVSALREIEHCPACDGAGRRIIYPSTVSRVKASGLRDPYGAHYQINQCVECGLLRSSPIFDPEAIGRLYSYASEANVAEQEIDNVRRTMAGYYGLMQEHLPARRRLLDIGCDRGLLLQVAREDGFAEVHGIEPNPAARRDAETLLGVPVSGQFYEEADYPPEHFDAITLIHVLDHLIDPALVLRRVMQHLQPGGIVLTVVHNVDSVLARMFGERFPIFNLYHHYFFSKRTLRRLFQHLGYETLFVGATTNCYSLGHLVGRIPGFPQATRRALARALAAGRLGSVAVTVRLGNIGIVARRPA